MPMNFSTNDETILLYYVDSIYQGKCNWMIALKTYRDRSTFYRTYLLAEKIGSVMMFFNH
ncbi:hypothetical protein LR48_Vigan09g220400 [Vigna angularis]|uniref:Uncharacterized protein n=1 Tax=Phaseolus angularis TaxID=3914 RepID=A0A0L9VER8_PHAAN|nr:uncharacterized protein HKW66_Vig0068000 [Vigna angularis]KOM53545.1 hypothetical protein LR48_Vigan09g220400 [Vigna angularis]